MAHDCASRHYRDCHRLDRFRSVSPGEVGGHGAGEVVEVGSERLRFDGVRSFQRDNYFTLQGQFTLLDRGVVVLPERRRYPVQEMPTTESGIHSTLWRDVYVVIAEPVGEGNQTKWGVHVYVNPLIQWIWGGGLMRSSGLALPSPAGGVRRVTQ